MVRAGQRLPYWVKVERLRQKENPQGRLALLGVRLVISGFSEGEAEESLGELDPHGARHDCESGKPWAPSKAVTASPWLSCVSPWPGWNPSTAMLSRVPEKDLHIVQLFKFKVESSQRTQVTQQKHPIPAASQARWILTPQIASNMSVGRRIGSWC